MQSVQTDFPFPQVFFEWVILIAKYAITSPKIDKLSNSKLSSWMILFKCMIFFLPYICYYFSEKRWNSWLIVKIWTFFRADVFINALFFCTNTVLFCRKSAKFATDCQKMNFSRGWYFFYKCAIFLPKYCYFAKIGEIRD